MRFQHATGQDPSGREIRFEHDLDGGRLLVASLDALGPLLHHGFDRAFGLRVSEALVVGGSEEYSERHRGEIAFLAPLRCAYAVQECETVGFVSFGAAHFLLLNALNNFPAYFCGLFGILERGFYEIGMAIVELQEQPFGTSVRPCDIGKTRPAVQAVVVEDIRIAKKAFDDFLLPLGFEFRDDARKPYDDLRIFGSGELLFE